MSLDSEGGLSSLYAPESTADGTWQGTFGVFLPCVTKGNGARISKVEPAGGSPKKFKAWLHTIPAGQGITPIGSDVGAPPNFDQPYADVEEDEVGTFEPFPDDYRVTAKCPAPFDPDAGMEELVVSMETGPEGVMIDGLKVTYTAGGREYVKTSPWTMILCGSEIQKSCNG